MINIFKHIELYYPGCGSSCIYDKLFGLVGDEWRVLWMIDFELY